MAEWGERQPDGSVVVYRDGVPVRHESWEQNQGLPGAGQPASAPGATIVGGETPPVAGATPGTYETKNGPKTIAQMRQELAAQGDARWADENQTDAYRVLTEYQRVTGGQMGYPEPAGPKPGGGSYPAAGGGGMPAVPGLGAGAGAYKDLIDAAIYANTMDALQRYALAKTAEERQAAYLDLQRWTQELSKTQFQQKQYTDVAQAILSAGTQLSSRPEDYFKFNQVVSGGRDIFDVMSGKSAPGAAFGGPAGHVRAGSAEDLLARLGIQYPQTPATPAGVQPGAPYPNVGLPAVPGAPGAPGGGGGGLPSLDEMKSGLRTAGWGGNWDDPNAVADAWWNADPARKGRPRPALAG